MVPFGKYSGHPVEVMLRDQRYVDWVTAQPWFRQRFGAIYHLILGQVPGAADTPVHNSIQVKFLDADFCQRFLASFMQPIIFTHELEAEFEKWGFDVVLFFKSQRDPICFVEIKPSIGDDFPVVLRQVQKLKRRGNAFIDVPVVLLLGEYVGSGVTYEQVVQMFGRSHVRVVLVQDIRS